MSKIMGSHQQILEVKLAEGGKDAGIILRAVAKTELPGPGQPQPAKPQPPANPTFVDYLRSGWQMNLACAIDYTASNGELDDDECLHYMGPQN